MVYCNFWCWRCSLFSNIVSNIKTNEINKRSQTLKLFFSSCFSINKKGDKVHNQTNCLILYVSLDSNHKHYMYIGIVRQTNVHYYNTVCKLVHDRFSLHIHITTWLRLGVFVCMTNTPFLHHTGKVASFLRGGADWFK